MTEQDMTEQDMTEDAIGPIDYLALELPARRMKGEGLAALVDLVDRGIIRVLDLRAVTREADGTFTVVAITDLDHDGRSTSPFSKASNPGCWMTTTCGRPPSSSSPGKWWLCSCTRTRGRLPSSRP